MLGELEQKIMNVIWASNCPLKPAQVQNALCCDLAYTTVMTVMKRLTDKGLLTREKKGNTYYYFGTTAKTDYAKNHLRKLFDSLVDSYGNVAISEFVGSLKDNPQDIQKLVDYLNNQDDQS